MSGNSKSLGRTGPGAYKDKEKPHEVRVSNITAAKGWCGSCLLLACTAVQALWALFTGVTPAHSFEHTAVADAIRTSLGPRGMDKMVRMGDRRWSECV